MVALAVIVLDKLEDGPTEVTRAERDRTVETLGFDGAHKPFGMSIRIRRTKRPLDHADAGLA